MGLFFNYVIVNLVVIHRIVIEVLLDYTGLRFIIFLFFARPTLVSNPGPPLPVTPEPEEPVTPTPRGACPTTPCAACFESN